jgi:DNA-binding SARP family transcriptional activator/pimeloyl-ACP methyl ester carboxylesterase
MPRERAPRLRLFLLGGFELHVDGSPVIDAAWARPNPTALLKLLALQSGRSIHREEAVEALWPHADARSGANNLHQALHLLRGALNGEQVFTMRDGLLALTPDVWIDVDAFRAAADAAFVTGDVSQHERALARYRGDLLPEDRYEEWIGAPRDDLAAMHRRLLLSLAKLHDAGGEYARAEQRARELIAVDPLDEGPHNLLMQLLERGGSLRRALAQYRSLRTALHAELGVEPSVAITAFADDIARRVAAGCDDPPAEPMDVRYVRSPDGTRIACTTHGSGDRPPLLHLPALPWSHLQVEWEMPQWRAWIWRLARGRMVARYDCRGTGLSQRDVDDVSVERQVEDIEAVVDALGWPRFDVFALENSGPALITYAVRHPEKIRRIVFNNTWANGPRYASIMQMGGFRQMRQHEWEVFRDSMTMMSTGYDEDLAPRVAMLLEHACSREMCDRYWNAVTDTDVTPLLPRLVAPSLMVRRRDSPTIIWEVSLELASLVRECEVREVDGSEYLMVAGDAEPLAAAIEDFLDRDEC